MHRDVEVVRATNEAFARADLTAILELFSPGVTVYQSPALPWGGSHQGHDGLLTFVATLSTTIEPRVANVRRTRSWSGRVSRWNLLLQHRRMTMQAR